VKVLTFTTVFPSAVHPLHGLFVAERTRHTSAHAEIRVISPVPWFRGRPERATPEAGTVDHPRFFYVPGLFKSVDGVFLFLSALPNVRRLRRRFDFDLIDAHFGYPDAVAASLLAAWFRRPVTITLRGSELDMARYRMRRAALGWALRRANRVIAVSGELAALARSLGAEASNVRVIGNGVDLERFRRIDRTTARRTLGVPDDAQLIVSVGHLARVKGFDLVLRAMPRLLAAHGRLRFAIVGGAAASSGSYPKELADEVAGLGLSDRVTITGPVPPDRVALWLNAADLFVLASEREGSPTALREALACGCPVVVSEVGDARDVVGAGSGCFVVDRTPDAWGDAIHAALETNWDRAAIRADAERHTWAAVAERVAAEWKACVAGDAVDGRVRARATAR
jgi:glycosyltransferase involved in cell wall biosynthesis